MENNAVKNLKKEAAEAALDYLIKNFSANTVLGVGTGSTVDYFINALAARKPHFSQFVSSSIATKKQLDEKKLTVLNTSRIHHLPVYIDGADEINFMGEMIKGGGGALTGEKILAAMTKEFICIATDNKLVNQLGKFPLPVEIISNAKTLIVNRFKNLNGKAQLRYRTDGSLFLTDNHNPILDVYNLCLEQPIKMEAEINSWPGVITVGLFVNSLQASRAFIASEKGIDEKIFTQVS